MTISFGTDGWRAVISDTFTFHNLRLLSQAIADAIATEDWHQGNGQGDPVNPRLMVVGYDTRFLSDRYAADVARVLAGNGFTVRLTQADAPTPAVSYAIKHLGAAGGIMITASHNAPRYNGLKLKAAYGGSALPEQCRRVELYLNDNEERARGPNQMDYDQAASRGLIRRFNPTLAYYDHLRTLVDFDVIANNPQYVVVDSMYGSGRGQFVDPHKIMALLLKYLVEKKGMRGTVVKTVSTTRMLNRLAAKYGLACRETPVGFNHIADLMLADDVLIGGEESGGITIKGHIPEGDGVLMGLLLLEMVCACETPLHDLVSALLKEVGPAEYARTDLRLARPVVKADLVRRLADNAPQAIGGTRVEQVESTDGVKYVMADDSWMLIRPSGTEPVLRVYVEARDQGMLDALMAHGKRIAESVT